MWRMSTGTPAFTSSAGTGERATLGRRTVLAIAAVFTMGDVQQAHAHLTQNAGQPLSGRDSLSPIVHVSGTSSELMPLASAMSNANSMPNKARLIPNDLTSKL
jgi:hypothetical protein